jgi:hypothetical protein
MLTIAKVIPALRFIFDGFAWFPDPDLWWSYPGRVLALRGKLAAQPVHPWRLRLERVRGTTGFDRLERIGAQMLMNILEVPQRQRTAG